MLIAMINTKIPIKSFSIVFAEILLRKVLPTTPPKKPPTIIVIRKENCIGGIVPVAIAVKSEAD